MSKIFVQVTLLDEDLQNKSIKYNNERKVSKQELLDIINSIPDNTFYISGFLNKPFTDRLNLEKK